MDVSIDGRWEGFVDEVVKAGRYASRSDVVREGLRLVEEREAKLRALRDTLSAAIEAGGAFSDEQIAADIQSEAASLDRRDAG